MSLLRTAKKKEEKFTTRDILTSRWPQCQLSLWGWWSYSFWYHRRSAVIVRRSISKRYARTASSITVSTVHHQGQVNAQPVIQGIFMINQQIDAVIAMISQGLWSVNRVKDWINALIVILDTGSASKGQKMRGDVWLVTTFTVRPVTDKLVSALSARQASSLIPLNWNVFRAQAAVLSAPVRLPALSVIAVSQPWTWRQANVTAKVKVIGWQVMMALVCVIRTSLHLKACVCPAVKL